MEQLQLKRWNSSCKSPSLFFSLPAFISNLDCWLNSHQKRKKIQLWSVKVGEKALGKRDRRMGSLAGFENALILTTVTEQRRFCMRDTAGGWEQIQTHVLWCPHNLKAADSITAGVLRPEISVSFVLKWRNYVLFSDRKVLIEAGLSHSNDNRVGAAGFRVSAWGAPFSPLLTLLISSQTILTK